MTILKKLKNRWTNIATLENDARFHRTMGGGYHDGHLRVVLTDDLFMDPQEFKKSFNLE